MRAEAEYSCPASFTASSTMISRSLECPERAAKRANDTSNRYRMRHMGPQEASASCPVSAPDRILGTHTVSKHTRVGVVRRVDVLEAVFPNIAEAMTAPVAGLPRPGRDDRLDAAAAAWTARRLAKGDADCLGAGEDDKTRYPMNIWV